MTKRRRPPQHLLDHGDRAIGGLMEILSLTRTGIRGVKRLDESDDPWKSLAQLTALLGEIGDTAQASLRELEQIEGIDSAIDTDFRRRMG